MIGETISHYRVLSPLGSGGMGEVYLTEDSRLGRKVAVKLLPPGLAADEEARRRFAQEARAASALNHPNIITIYDIGTEQGRDFIAMEFVDGESLRTTLGRGKLDIKRALQWISQAASALAAAHEAGIVHRDIKPENLMVSRSNHIKVLDFGLAKLVEKHSSVLAHDAATATDLGVDAPTRSGVIVGTFAYMSPEQAEGRPLDRRADIFSLGLVLYELLTGEKAFSANSAIDTLHKILHDDPPPVTDSNSQLPPEVNEIVVRAIEKDPAERYQHAGDFELDLRRLTRAIESKTLLSTRTQLAPHGLSPQEPLQPRFLGSKPLRTAAAAATIGIAMLAGWLIGRSRPPLVPAVGLENATLTPLTTDPGYEGDPTFSPDGETVAYTSDRTGNFEIFLKQVSGGPDINITNNPADDIQPAFSPDGKQIAFVSSRNGSPDVLYFGTETPLMGGAIWVMPALGGIPRRVADSGNFPAWSPDGSHILYMSGTWFHTKLYRVSSAGGQAEEIPIRFRPGQAAPQFLMYPSYSPDGRWIAFEPSGDNVYVVSASGGEAQIVANGRRPVWNPDSKAIFYSSADPGKNYSLWKVPFSTADGKVAGSPAPLTVGRGRDVPGAVSRDGKRIAFTAREEAFNLEIMPFSAEAGRVRGEPRQVTSGAQGIYFSNFSPDGRSVVFDARKGAERHIWRVEPGAAPTPLTSDSNYIEQYPRWSPDGRSISFGRSPAQRAQATELWLMAADGANPQPLLRGVVAPHAWAPDANAIVYGNGADQQIFYYDLATKQSRRIINEPGAMPILAVSPDGKWVVYQSTQNGNVDLRAVEIGGGPSRPVVTTPHQDYHPFISPSGRWLYFHLDHKNLWRVPGPAQDWREAAPEKITDFPESGLFLEDIQISRDGTQLLYSRGHITGDVWILNLGSDRR